MASPQADRVRPRHASSQAPNGSLPQRSQLAELHRARILAATARALDERGYPATTVATVVAAARVSRSRFYELFGGSDGCVEALLDELVAHIAHHLDERGVGAMPWEQRMREGLWLVLSCLEQEPLLARACVVHSVGASAEGREQVIESLVGEVDTGREVCGHNHATRMTAEGVVGAATRLVYSRLAAGGEALKLTDLFAELTGLILLPYLGPEQTHLIQQRPAPEPVSANGSRPLGGALTTSAETADPLKGIAIRLTYRTARTLQAVSQQPGASNRAIANGAGIADPGQASKLLARLERLGLITNEAASGTKWELNSWTLTLAGSKLVALLGGRASASAPDVPGVAVFAQAEGA